MDSETPQKTNGKEVIGALFAKGKTARHAKGRLLIYAGDRVDQFFFIKSGFVRVYVISDDGEERTLLILTSADIFPLLKDPERPSSASLYFYETIEDSELVTIRQQDLLDRVQGSREAAWSLFRYVSDFSSALTNRIAQLESKSAEEKVGQLFDYLIDVCGQPAAPNNYKLRLKLTHQDIANLVGHTRETASIVIKKLEGQGLLSYEEGFFVINKRPA